MKSVETRTHENNNEKFLPNFYKQLTNELIELLKIKNFINNFKKQKCFFQYKISEAKNYFFMITSFHRLK